MTIEQLTRMGFREYTSAGGRRRLDYWRVTATEQSPWGGTVPTRGFSVSIPLGSVELVDADRLRQIIREGCK